MEKSNIDFDLKKKLLDLVWSSSDERQIYQDLNINVLPVNFYSNTPSLADINDSFEYLEKDPPYDSKLLFNNQVMLEELKSLQEFAADFSPIYEGDPQHCQEYFWNNSEFSYSDAMSYYCFIRKYQPKRIVEIGAGFSTLVALAAIKKNGHGEITCFEPFPRQFLQNHPDVKLVAKKAQEITVHELNEYLQEGDFLFIDSTHTVKTGSDCLHIYLRLLPYLDKKLLIHVHDIFLPFGMPKAWLKDLHIYWTEQYLLMAYLLRNPDCQVIFGSAYNNHFNHPELKQLMHERKIPGGSSFWFWQKNT